VVDAHIHHLVHIHVGMIENIAGDSPNWHAAAVIMNITK
jgi:hypothetical protein